jgi:hypothetical protein
VARHFRGSTLTLLLTCSCPEALIALWGHPLKGHIFSKLLATPMLPPHHTLAIHNHGPSPCPPQNTRSFWLCELAQVHTLSSIDKDDESNLASTLTLSVAGECGTPPAISTGSKQVSAASAVARACDDEALALASDAVQDAATIDSAHNLLRANHHKIFLMKAFEINPDTAHLSRIRVFSLTVLHSIVVKSVEHYKKMVHFLSNWGDDAVLANAPEDDLDTNRICKFWHKHKAMGYTYVGDFFAKDAESLDGIPKKLLIHCRTGGIVVDMVTICDVIWEAHQRIGHLGHDKTHGMFKKTYYSPTQALIKIFGEGCSVCLEKQPKVPPCKGTKKPIISSHFCDCFQVDLLDRRSRRTKDVYVKGQQWIMTVKDHSTGLIYLCALPKKKVSFVAYELEKYFGFVGYPQIFHIDNGKEFIALVVQDLLINNNPNCFLVTGRPRTPCDQGSVESGNKLVQQIMKSILSQQRQAGLEDNWTKFLS